MIVIVAFVTRGYPFLGQRRTRNKNLTLNIAFGRTPEWCLFWNTYSVDSTNSQNFFQYCVDCLAFALFHKRRYIAGRKWHASEKKPSNKAINTKHHSKSNKAEYLEKTGGVEWYGWCYHRNDKFKTAKSDMKVGNEWQSSFASNEFLFGSCVFVSTIHAFCHGFWLIRKLQSFSIYSCAMFNVIFQQQSATTMTTTTPSSI